jgi:hypothetical protein
MKLQDFNYEVHFKTGSPMFIAGQVGQGISLPSDFEAFLKNGTPLFGRYRLSAEKSVSDLVICFADVRAVLTVEPKSK